MKRWSAIIKKVCLVFVVFLLFLSQVHEKAFADSCTVATSDGYTCGSYTLECTEGAHCSYTGELTNWYDGAYCGSTWECAPDNNPSYPSYSYPAYCVPHGCDAPPPACGQTTYGTNGCGLTCERIMDCAPPPSYPSYPGYPGYPSYPDYPVYPSYATYPAYNTYPAYASYPSYPGYPGYPAYATYPGYATYPSYPAYAASYTVSCASSPNPALLGQEVTWTATVNGAAGPFTYVWSGNGIPVAPAPTTSTYKIRYKTLGTKNATVVVTNTPTGEQASCPVAGNSGTVKIKFFPRFQEF